MSIVYLIPSFLADHASQTIPNYVLEAVKNSQVIFAENERTARRFLKEIDKSIVIDDYEWHTLHKVENEQIDNFKKAVKDKKNISIISEAGCPGIADPGQDLIAVAQKLNCQIKPLVGPNAIILGLMASGMNGQSFEFVGYLPIDNGERIKKIKELESSSSKNNSTKIFIETPYRNNQLVDALLNHCNHNTQLCIGFNITAENETIKTRTISEWKSNKPHLDKAPAVFMIYAGKSIIAKN